MERAKKWMPKAEIDVPCADISFTWASGKDAALVVVMHFSRVIDGLDRDLEIVFRNPLAVRWEDESFGLIECPEDLPKCSPGKFRTWAYPTLIVENSKWAQEYSARKYAENDPNSQRVAHYFLVSMNDLLHILAESEPTTQWVSNS
jgi:hypothetical protein